MGSHTIPPTAAPAPATHILGDPSIEGLARYVLENDVRRILVLLGAGASVAAGIPDFRSPGTGIYANLGRYNLDDPTDAFSLPLLREKPHIFYSIAQEMNLWPGHFLPTPVHKFIRLLQEQGRLLRCCTQNIDGLEKAAGIAPELLVEAHGSFAAAACIDCKAPFSIEQNRRDAMQNMVSHCATCGGVVKPNVVFFGESLPEAFFDVVHHDAPTAELVIIIGTSLQVHPFASLPYFVPTSVPRVVINCERVGGLLFRFPDDPPNCVYGGEESSSTDSKGRSAHDVRTESSSEQVEGTANDASSSSSSDGYAQYGDYDAHPEVCRDLLLRGDCQEVVKKLAACLGWSAELRESVGGGAALDEEREEEEEL